MATDNYAASILRRREESDRALREARVACGSEQGNRLGGDRPPQSPAFDVVRAYRGEPSIRAIRAYRTPENKLRPAKATPVNTPFATFHNPDFVNRCRVTIADTRRNNFSFSRTRHHDMRTRNVPLRSMMQDVVHDPHADKVEESRRIDRMECVLDVGEDIGMSDMRHTFQPIVCGLRAPATTFNEQMWKLEHHTGRAGRRNTMKFGLEGQSLVKASPPNPTVQDINQVPAAPDKCTKQRWSWQPPKTEADERDNARIEAQHGRTSTLAERAMVASVRPQSAVVRGNSESRLKGEISSVGSARTRPLSFSAPLSPTRSWSAMSRPRSSTPISDMREDAATVLMRSGALLRNIV